MNKYLMVQKFLFHEKGFYIEYDLIKLLIEKFVKEKGIDFIFHDSFLYQYDNELISVGKLLLNEEEEKRLIEVLSKKLKIIIEKDTTYGDELKVYLGDKEIINQYL